VVADLAYLLITFAAAVAAENQAGNELYQLTALWAASVSYAGLSLLLVFALLYGVENRWVALSRRWVGLKAVAVGWACIFVINGALLLSGLRNPHPDRYTTLQHISTGVCLVSSITIHLLFSVLALIPPVAAIIAIVVHHKAKKPGQEQQVQQPQQQNRNTWSVAQLGQLKMRLLRLAGIMAGEDVAVCHILPGMALLPIHYYYGWDKCESRKHYRLLEWGQLGCSAA